jgi:hypothetical protein
MKISRAAIDEAAASLAGPIGKFIAGQKKKIPSHLKSVPDQNLLLPYTPSDMIFVYEAIARGIHKRDLGYPCPEMLVVID